MNDKKFYGKLKNKMGEVSSLPQHNFGGLTKYYKETAFYFKNAPYRLGIVFSILFVFFLFFILGPSFVRLATILSGGF